MRIRLLQPGRPPVQEHHDVIELPSALNEARTALSAARRLGGQAVFLCEELGDVRLLLGNSKVTSSWEATALLAADVDLA